MINYAAKFDGTINNLKYTKFVKAVTKPIAAVQVINSAYNGVDAYLTDDANKGSVISKAVVDVIVVGITTWGGPIGWFVGGAYLLCDVTGVFGYWGKPAGHK